MGRHWLLLAATVAMAQDPPATRPATPGDLADTRAGSLVARIEAAHGAALRNSREAVRARVTVQPDGEPPIRAVMTCETRGGRCRIEIDDGPVLVFDGARAWVSPADAPDDPATGKARSQLRGWPYLLQLPFKLRDPGVEIAAGDLSMFQGKLCETLDVSFDPDTGDTPGDRYRAYVEPRTDRLAGLRRTAGDGRTTAIVYQGTIPVHGDITTGAVWMSTIWSFHDWSPTTGVGAATGSARLDEVTLVTPDPHAFRKPDDAREAGQTVPGPGS